MGTPRPCPCPWPPTTRALWLKRLLRGGAAEGGEAVLLGGAGIYHTSRCLYHPRAGPRKKIDVLVRFSQDSLTQASINAHQVAYTTLSGPTVPPATKWVAQWDESARVAHAHFHHPN